MIPVPTLIKSILFFGCIGMLLMSAEAFYDYLSHVNDQNTTRIELALKKDLDVEDGSETSAEQASKLYNVKYTIKTGEEWTAKISLPEAKLRSLRHGKNVEIIYSKKNPSSFFFKDDPQPSHPKGGKELLIGILFGIIFIGWMDNEELMDEIAKETHKRM